MNRVHDFICSSDGWARRVETELLPWGLDGVALGDDVLEVGPGFGATTARLAGRTQQLSVLELEERYCQRLRARLGDRVAVTQGDATAMPYESGRFSSVVCFTMLHHLPGRSAQDTMFAEVARVLAPGGVFAGTDSVGRGLKFKLIHIGDTLHLIDPDELPERLTRAGLVEVAVEHGERSMRWRARKPAPGESARGQVRKGL